MRLCLIVIVVEMIVTMDSSAADLAADGNGLLSLSLLSLFSSPEYLATTTIAAATAIKHVAKKPSAVQQGASSVDEAFPFVYEVSSIICLDASSDNPDNGKGLTYCQPI